MCDVPALRFPEFTGEWSVKSISDLANVIGGGTPDTTIKSYWNGNIQWFTPSEIGKTKYVELSLRTITLEGLNNSNAKLLPPYTILLSSRATVGECSIALQECATNQGFQSLIAKNCDIDFLYYLIQTKKKDLIRKACGSTFLEISANEIRKIHTNVPSNAEQKKIGALLSLIDKRIETQNKIIEDLKKLKSAIVEMILCKQGGVLLKLGDVGSFIRGLTYSSEDIAEDINATTVIRANNLNYGNNVNKKDVVYVNKKPTEIQILRKGDIVICMANGSSSLVGKNSYYSFDDRQSTIGAFCGIYRSSQPLVKWLMQSQRYRRLVYQSLQGGNGAIANLNGDDILNMTFRVVEDKKSVSILSTIVLIENFISVNEKLQELYSIQKKYLLQHLFI